VYRKTATIVKRCTKNIPRARLYAIGVWRLRGSVVGVAVVDRSSNAYEKLTHVSPELIDPYKRSHASDFSGHKKILSASTLIG
jgi:hypothetical protein